MSIKLFLKRLFQQKEIVANYDVINIKANKLHPLEFTIVVEIWLRDVEYKNKNRNVYLAIRTDELQWFGGNLERALYGNSVHKAQDIIEEFKLKSIKAKRYLTKHLDELDEEGRYKKEEKELFEKYS